MVLGPKWGSSADGFICQPGCPLIEAVSCVIRPDRREKGKEKEETLHAAPASEDIAATYTLLNQQSYSHQ